MFQIPKQPKQVRERIEVKLDQGLVQKLERYSEYLDSDRDYIVSQVLQIAFKKDKGFADWLKSHGDAGPAEQATAQEEKKRSPRGQSQAAAGTPDTLFGNR